MLNDDVGLTPETEKDVLALLADEFTAETSTLGRVEVATDRDTGRRGVEILDPAFRPHLFERFEARPSSNGKRLRRSHRRCARRAQVSVASVTAETVD